MSRNRGSDSPKLNWTRIQDRPKRWLWRRRRRRRGGRATAAQRSQGGINPTAGSARGPIPCGRRGRRGASRPSTCSVTSSVSSAGTRGWVPLESLPQAIENQLRRKVDGELGEIGIPERRRHDSPRPAAGAGRRLAARRRSSRRRAASASMFQIGPPGGIASPIVSIGARLAETRVEATHAAQRHGRSIDVRRGCRETSSRTLFGGRRPRANHRAAG